MGYIEEEQQAMLEHAVLERTKEYEARVCAGCSSPSRFLHKCTGSKEYECACQHFSCKREREKRSK